MAVQSIRLTRKIAKQPSFARLYVRRNSSPVPTIESDEELDKAAGDIGTTIFHPVGTCRMGSQIQKAWSIRSLRFRALKRLRVADASIMPTITSGNTNSPTIMIAEKAAEMILADNR